MQKPYVFISYSTIDQDYADKVNSTLKDNGINTWIATEDIHGGESFATEITNGIKGCDAFVFVLSQNSDNSPHCGNELSLAFSARKKIIPFRLHEFDISESNTYFLQQAQWIDIFSDEDWAFSELVRQIQAHFSIERTESAPVKINLSHGTSKQIDNFVLRAELALEDGDFDGAKKFANDALNIDATYAKAYLVLMLCDLRILKKEDLASASADFSLNANYKKALRFADNKTSEFLEKALNDVRARLDEERKERERKEQERLEQARIEQERIEKERLEWARKEKERIENERKEKERIELERLEKERKEQERVENERREQVRLEQERVENERKEKEQHLERLKKKREEIACVQNLICAGYSYSLGLKLNGTVFAVGMNQYKQCNVSRWNNIVAISAGFSHTLGLKTDGTVVAIGDNGCRKCNVSDWQNIVAISAGFSHTLGLKSDGTVVAVGYPIDGRCDVASWKDIIAISAGEEHSLGLKSNGTVVAVGSNGSSQCNVSKWKDIVAISAGEKHSLGLKADGTVVATGSNESYQCNVSTWDNIVAISAGGYHSLGLKADGTVVAVGYHTYGQFDVLKWKDIVAISAGTEHSLGLKTDGTVVAVGSNEDCQSNVHNVKLFNDFKNITEMEQIKLQQKRMAQYRAQGLCQHCGGTLKGLFTKTCTSCGRKKDY